LGAHGTSSRARPPRPMTAAIATLSNRKILQTCASA
jgi:hypothetical protein